MRRVCFGNVANNSPGKYLSHFSRAWRVKWNIGAVTGGTLPIPKELPSQKSSSIGSTRPLAECGMQQTKGHELNGDKTSDDGKVDKEPKCWFNTRTGLVFECSFKFPTEVNPDVVRAGLENGVLKMVIL